MIFLKTFPKAEFNSSVGKVLLVLGTVNCGSIVHPSGTHVQ